MFDLSGSEIILTIMIVLLGITLVIIGIQLFFVLKDLRKSLARTDRILSDVEKVSAKVVVQQEHADEILQGLRTMVSSVSTATSSVSNLTSKFLGPASVGLTAFQTVSRILAKQAQTKAATEEESSDEPKA